MRSIGQIIGEDRARTLGNYLLFQDIDNQIEKETDGSFSIWVVDEDKVATSRAILSGFLSNPDDPRFQVGSVRRPPPKKQKVLDRTNLFRASYSFGVGPLTATLVAICAALFYATYFLHRMDIASALMMSGETERFVGGGRLSELSEIFHGQIWRLFTPALLHQGVLHVLFDLLWLKDLGSLIEARLGSLKFIIMVCVIAALSNLTQFFWAGPGFSGMSGVVYGLFAYIWIRGRYDVTSGLFMPPQIVTMMIIWFFVGWIPGMNIANGAHAGGLVFGMIWGYLDSGRLWRLR